MPFLSGGYMSVYIFQGSVESATTALGQQAGVTHGDPKPVTEPRGLLNHAAHPNAVVEPEVSASPAVRAASVRTLKSIINPRVEGISSMRKNRAQTYLTWIGTASIYSKSVSAWLLNGSTHPTLPELLRSTV